MSSAGETDLRPRMLSSTALSQSRAVFPFSAALVIVLVSLTAATPVKIAPRPALEADGSLSAMLILPGILDAPTPAHVPFASASATSGQSMAAPEGDKAVKRLVKPPHTRGVRAREG